MLNFELHRSVHCWNEINVLHIYVTWHKQKWNISSVLVCSTFSMFWTTSTWLGSAWRQSSIDVRKVRVQFMDLPRSEDNCIIVPTIALQYKKKWNATIAGWRSERSKVRGSFFQVGGRRAEEDERGSLYFPLGTPLLHHLFLKFIKPQFWIFKYSRISKKPQL